MSERLPFVDSEIIVQGLGLIGPLTGESRTTKSGNRVVIDNIGAGNLDGAVRSMGEQGYVGHFTLDVENRRVYQHIDLKFAPVIQIANVQMAHQRGQTAWLRIIKHLGDMPNTYDMSWIALIISKVVETVGAPAVVRPGSAPGQEALADVLALNEWTGFSGVCAAHHMPGLETQGPGALDWALIEDALGGEDLVTEPEPVRELEDLKVAELRALATKIDGANQMKKADLIDALRAPVPSPVELLASKLQSVPPL